MQLVCVGKVWMRRIAGAGAAVAMMLAAATVSGSAFERRDDVQQYFGRIEFERDWTPATSATLFDGFEPPASFSIWDGLGPLYNESSCVACHLGPAMAGRFVPSGADGVSAIGLVVRLGDARGLPDPHYGEQIQTRAIEGVMPEARVMVFLPQGAEPGHGLDLDLLQGDLAPGTARAALASPALVGRGEIDRVDPAAIEAAAAAQAARDDGINGTVHRISTPGGQAIGRYGYKAEHPSLFHRIAYSFFVEMGISSRLVPADYGDCTAQQHDCLAEPASENRRRLGFEVSDPEIEIIAAYLSGLLAPAQTDPDHEIDPSFTASGCGSCHIPTLPAHDGGTVVLYSDLLLHDMGADFDNGIGAHGLPASHWRTAPLLALAPYSGRRYLHDGRAPDLDAAIRAHGGEAQASRLAYESLDEPSRLRLIAFLESL